MRAFRPGVMPSLVVLLLLPLLLSLGAWQLQRADEKSALLDRQEARRQAPAQAIGELEQSADLAFRRVLLRGYFDAEHSVLLDNRTRDGRVGVELLQPFYDVAKLLRKAPASVNTMDDTYMACALIFTVVGGGIFVSGSNTLLCAFMVTLAAIFVVLASASTQSPFAQVGADRELLQVMSYEPAVLLMSVGLYLATDSFDSIAVTGQSAPIIVYSAPIFLALLAVLTIKLRKSPFDLSYSHHAHQEIVQGVATEMSGGTLAKMTLMHWCETVLFLMWVGMFFVWDNPVSWVVALVVMAATYFVEVLIDNTFARSTWRSCFRLGWGVALVFGLLNLMPILVDVFI